jgi:hypothetical protein
MKTAAGFNEGPGMVEQLRELADAEPFGPFTIRMLDGRKYRITKKEHIQFTHYGSPKVWAPVSKHAVSHHEMEPSGPCRWHVLNVDSISEIIL